MILDARMNRNQATEIKRGYKIPAWWDGSPYEVTTTTDAYVAENGDLVVEVASHSAETLNGVLMADALATWDDETGIWIADPTAEF